MWKLRVSDGSILGLLNMWILQSEQQTAVRWEETGMKGARREAQEDQLLSDDQKKNSIPETREESSNVEVPG